MNNLNNLTFADLISAKIVSKFKALTKVHADVILVTAGIAYIALFAQFSILIPPVSPVVFTMQTFAVFSASAALGMRRALITNFGYMLLGSLGAPIFAGGSSGFGGVSFGYIIGFIASAAVVGFLGQKGFDKSVVKTFGMFVVANLITYTFGVAYLMFSLGISNILKGFQLGLFPFIPGDLVKILFACAVLPSLWKLVQKFSK